MDAGGRAMQEQLPSDSITQQLKGLLGYVASIRPNIGFPQTKLRRV
ncbi:MAG: hypothetical protein LUQ26_12530 [Methylococcaceae bacterium]|nr:hypothetical protein [Methylococcaceae bacterium]